MEDESVLWEAPAGGAGKNKDVDKAPTNKKDGEETNQNDTVVNNLDPALGGSRSTSAGHKGHDQKPDGENNVMKSASSSNLDERGHAVRLVLEQDMKLGAKIKSFQHPSEVSGEVERVQDARQPLCILITEIYPSGAAERFGLSTKDRLLLVDAAPVESFSDYKDVLGVLRDKRPLALTFLAFGQNAALKRSASHSSRSNLDSLLNGKTNPSIDADSRIQSLSSLQSVSTRSDPGGSDFQVVNTKTKKQLLVEKHELALMSNEIIAVRRVATGGIAERYRPVFWRLLLNYLPIEVTKWKETLKQQRALYEEYKNEFLKLGLSSAKDGNDSSRPSRLKGQGWWEHEAHVKTAHKAGIHNEAGAPAKTENSSESAVIKDESDDARLQTFNDDQGSASGTASRASNLPGFAELSFTEQREIKERERAALPPERRAALERHEHDVELRETIWKDVQRTHPGMHFFADTRCEIMERILFIYAKLNPGIKYVQGMNEVLAPILFVFGSSSPEGNLDEKQGAVLSRLELEQYEFEQHYEVDAFFCFCNLMGDLRDLYMQGMDTDSAGIKGKGEALMQLVKVVDYPVYNHLTELDVNPQFFAMRWITTLLSRELMLPDTVRLWDTLFADPSRFEFLLRACSAMVSLQRGGLLRADFAGCLQILQKYPPTDLEEILALAAKIGDNPGSPLFKEDPNAPSQLPTAEQAQARLKSAVASTAAALNTENLLSGASTLANFSSDLMKKSRLFRASDSKS